MKEREGNQQKMLGEQILQSGDVYWQQSYGWRSGSRYVEKGATVADIVRHWRDKGNDHNIPDFLLPALETVPAHQVIWVCRTKEDAKRYALDGDEPYQEDFEQNSIILTTDNEQEKGYFILTNPRALSPDLLKRLAEHRQGSDDRT